MHQFFLWLWYQDAKKNLDILSLGQGLLRRLPCFAPMIVPISMACDVLGVCARTLRRWEHRGILIPYRTPGNHRRYDYDALLEFRESCVYDPQPAAKTGVAAVYARVSSPKQKEDLVRQVDFLRACAKRDGLAARIYTDVWSGLNDARPGLLRLLRDGLNCRFDRVYLTYLGRLGRFGTRPLVEMLGVAGVDVKAVHVPEAQTFEQALVADVVALLTSFWGKLHRRRRGQNVPASRADLVPPHPTERLAVGAGK